MLKKYEVNKGLLAAPTVSQQLGVTTVSYPYMWV